MSHTSRHFRLTRLAHMRSLKARRQTDGSYLVSSHSRPAHFYRVTSEGECECAARLSCSHGELVLKIEMDRSDDVRAWQAYQDAFRADFYRLRLRILRGKVRGTDREYLAWCRRARPVSAVAAIRTRPTVVAEAF